MKRGFTLIEMLVVLTTFVIILPAFFSIFYSILKEQTKIIALQEAKNQGDFALNAVEDSLRNSAIAVYSTQPDPTDPSKNKICQSAGSTGDVSYISDKFGNWFRFYLDSNNRITSESSITNASASLTNSKVVVSSFKISCSNNSSFSEPLISISFQIRYNTTSTRPEETASLNYQTKIKLRSL